MSWEVLNIETEAKKKLKNIQKQRGFTSLSKTIEFLAEVHKDTREDVAECIANRWRAQ